MIVSQQQQGIKEKTLRAALSLARRTGTQKPDNTCKSRMKSIIKQTFKGQLLFRQISVLIQMKNDGKNDDTIRFAHKVEFANTRSTDIIGATSEYRKSAQPIHFPFLL